MIGSLPIDQPAYFEAAKRFAIKTGYHLTEIKGPELKAVPVNAPGKSDEDLKAEFAKFVEEENQQRQG